MEIGNTEGGMDGSNRAGSSRRDSREQLQRENRCIKCHKVGCRPWKHSERTPTASNSKFIGECFSEVDINGDQSSTGSESEN